MTGTFVMHAKCINRFRMRPLVIFRCRLDAWPIGQLAKASSTLFGIDLQIAHYISYHNVHDAPV